jgi:hypothetical protein
VTRRMPWLRFQRIRIILMDLGLWISGGRCDRFRLMFAMTHSIEHIASYPGIERVKAWTIF